MKPSAILKHVIGIGVFVVGSTLSVASAPAEPDPDPDPEPEVPDTEPCGTDGTPSFRFAQDLEPLAEGDQVGITTGSAQGGGGSEGIDLFVYLDNVNSEEATVTDVTVRLVDDAGITVASSEDNEFFCFDGELRTREISMALLVDSFDLDGASGQAIATALVNGTEVSTSIAIDY